MKQLFSQNWRPALNRWLPDVLLIASGLLFLFNWIRTVFGSYVLNQFDGALRLLPHYYVQAGLIPYKDFGVVYPPGLFWLVGKIFPFTSLPLKNGILLIVFTVFLAISGYALLKLLASSPLRQKKIVMSCFLFSTIILFQIFDNEPLSVPLLLSIVSVSFLALVSPKPSSQTFVLLGLLSLFPVFLRWDWFLFLIVLQALAILMIFILRNFFPETKSSALGRWLTILLVQACGYAAGALLLFTGLQLSQTTQQAWEFLFTIPVQVIFQYRRLPLPSFGPLQNIQDTLYVALFSLLWLAGFILWPQLKKTSLKAFFTWALSCIPEIFLFTFPAALLPYAIGRADWQHALPLWQMCTLALVLYGAFRRPKLCYWGVFIILFLPLLRILLVFPQNWHPEQNKYAHAIDRDLENCRQLTLASPSASLFVGRKNYDHYVINSAALYLIRPDVRPATAYISDEPGLQSSCFFGSKIAQQLSDAPKPMLAFLEVKPQGFEPNATAHMVSCGKIEQYLRSAKSELIGECSAFDKKFEVKLYK